jgi:hypothetical protein
MTVRVALLQQGASLLHDEAQIGKNEMNRGREETKTGGG